MVELGLTENRFAAEGITKGVSLDTLHRLYADHSREDVDMMKKHGMRMAVERVAQRDGNRFVVDTAAKLMGMTRKMRYDTSSQSKDREAPHLPSAKGPLNQDAIIS